jgi:DNA-binding response OmpR family regulator
MYAMRSQNIFIAEDDSGILDLLRIRLELAGYSTSYARDGQAAITGINSGVPDGVILDIGLPTLNGFEVLRSIRAHQRTRDIPVLMLTARHDSSDVQRAILNGAQDYLTKPFDDQKLLARVARLVRTPARPKPSAFQSVCEI